MTPLPRSAGHFANMPGHCFSSMPFCSRNQVTGSMNSSTSSTPNPRMSCTSLSNLNVLRSRSGICAATDAAAARAAPSKHLSTSSGRTPRRIKNRAHWRILSTPMNCCFHTGICTKSSTGTWRLPFLSTISSKSAMASPSATLSFRRAIRRSSLATSASFMTFSASVRASRASSMAASNSSSSSAVGPPSGAAGAGGASAFGGLSSASAMMGRRENRRADCDCLWNGCRHRSSADAL
mmetsp:Transcript_348/g.834  ORF Transcript_348/g.834 Transcript_348/m.834 type:complete len:237 (-) Transcript_348:137-847(-)